MISKSFPGTLEVPRKSQIRESFGPVQRNAMPTAPARAMICLFVCLLSAGVIFALDDEAAQATRAVHLQILVIHKWDS